LIVPDTRNSTLTKGENMEPEAFVTFIETILALENSDSAVILENFIQEYPEEWLKTENEEDFFYIEELLQEAYQTLIDVLKDRGKEDSFIQEVETVFEDADEFKGFSLKVVFSVLNNHDDDDLGGDFGGDFFDDALDAGNETESRPDTPEKQSRRKREWKEDKDGEQGSKKPFKPTIFNPISVLPATIIQSWVEYRSGIERRFPTPLDQEKKREAVEELDYWRKNSSGLQHGTEIQKRCIAWFKAIIADEDVYDLSKFRYLHPEIQLPNESEKPSPEE